MARIPYVDSDSVTGPVREKLERSPVAFLRMLAHAPTAFEPWVDYAAALLGELELDPVLREFAILQVARLRDTEYQWVQHAALARAVGASAEQIAAIKEGREDHASLDGTQREVLRFSREITLTGVASEQSTSELAARLGPRPLVELLLVVGHWVSSCTFIDTLQLQPDLPAMAGALPETLALRDPSGP